MNTLKAFECRDRAADNDAEFQKRMVLPYREMRPDSESCNDADEMRATTWFDWARPVRHLALLTPTLVAAFVYKSQTLITCSKPNEDIHHTPVSPWFATRVDRQ